MIFKQTAVEMALGVIIPIAIGHKIEEYVKIFEAKLGLLDGDFVAAVSRIVAHPADKIHSSPDVVSDNVAEIGRIHKADQGVLIRRIKSLVHRIHPLDGEFHRPPADASICRIRSAATAAPEKASNRPSLVNISKLVICFPSNNATVIYSFFVTRELIQNVILIFNLVMHNSLYFVNRNFNC